MPRSRREFLANSSFGLMGVAVSASTGCSTKPPGAPAAFGTSPPVGPAVSPQTFAEAEKLVQVEMTAKDRAQAAVNWQQSLASVYERRVGPRKLILEESIAPATVWNPTLPGSTTGSAKDSFSLRSAHAPALPSNENDIAFAPVTFLSQWIKSRQITSERLTKIYLQRLETFDPKLHCVITLTRNHALQQAREADKEIAAGKYRGPLHGIPWARKTCSIRPAFPPHTARNPTAIEFPKRMQRSLRG